MLSSLNAVVKELQKGELPANSTLRMADWEALGRVMSIQADKEELWDETVVDLKLAQNNFLADGEVVIEAIDTWINDVNPAKQLASNLNRWATARELYTESQQLLFAGNKPDSDWPRSVKAFSKRLMGIKSILTERYGMTTRISRGQTQYSFEHK